MRKLRLTPNPDLRSEGSSRILCDLIETTVTSIKAMTVWEFHCLALSVASHVCSSVLEFYFSTNLSSPFLVMNPLKGRVGLK